MRTVALLLFFFGLAALASAQEPDSIHRADTLLLKRLVFPGPKSSLARPSFIPPSLLLDAEITREFPTSFLGYALLSGPAVPEERLDLSWQIGLGRMQEDPIGSIRMVLGAAQAGGAAYLAYRHIKKYGFLK